MALGPESLVKVHGLRELEEALRALPQRLAERAVNEALTEAITPMRDTAAALVPSKSGRIAASIVIRGSGKPDRFGEAVKQVVSTDFRARFLEFGTAPHTIEARVKKVLFDARSGKFFGRKVAHPGAAARPFMRPAFDTHKDGAIAIFRDALERRIREIAAQLRRRARRP